MWENAAPTPPPQHGSPSSGRRRRVSQSDGDYVIWGQLLLSLAFLALVLLAQMLDLPFLPALRTAFREAMMPEQNTFLSENRELSKFTEQAVQTLANTVQKFMPAQSQTATPENAVRQTHAKAQQVPSGAREESYLPSFAICFPLAGRACTETSGYGWRTDPMGGSGSDFHLGNDLAADEGTAILAAADGVVRCAGVHSSYGRYVRILHANGDETLYAHMQYLFVHTGQRVSAGDCLGTVGETGNATGPHLHFELLHKGIRYDPSEALQNAA